MGQNMAGLGELALKDDVVQAALKNHKDALVGDLSNQVTNFDFETAVYSHQQDHDK